MSSTSMPPGECELPATDAGQRADPPTTEIGAVAARGYWEQVWRRFRRDRVAIASTAFLVLLVPRRARRGLPPCGPDQPCHELRHRRARPPGPRCRRHARPRRVPPPAVRRPRLPAGRGVLDDPRDERRRHPRRDRRLLPRVGRRDHLAADRDHHGVPGAALRDRARERSPASGGYRIVLEFFLPSREALDAKYVELTGFGYVGHCEPYDVTSELRFAMVDDPDGNTILLSASTEPS